MGGLDFDSVYCYNAGIPFTGNSVLYAIDRAETNPQVYSFFPHMDGIFPADDRMPFNCKWKREFCPRTKLYCDMQP